MIDPYRMVVVNIIASAILLTAFFIYKYIYPKKTPPYLLMLFLVSLLPLISLLRKGSYESGDLTLHAVRTLSFYQILFGEWVRPTWFPQLNSGYGDPHFLFSYFLPYFFGSILHHLGLSILASIKLLIAISYIFSGLFMYQFIKNELKSEKAGFVAAVFYLFTPYHLIDIHFRVTIAESISFVYLPLLLFLTSKIIDKFKISYLILISITYASLILTHQAVSLGFSIIILTFIFFKINYKKNKLKKLFYTLLSLSLGLGISAFYWMPIILESRYTQVTLYKSIFIFPELSELLFSKWMYGFLFQGHYGELSFLIGYTQILVLLIAILMTKLKKIIYGKELGYYFLTLSIILILLILPYSEVIWQKFPLLKYFQFSYRLLVFLCLSIAVLSGIITKNAKNRFFIGLLVLLTIFYTGLNWGNRKSLPEINSTFIINQLNTDPDVGDYLEPTSPIWATADNKDLRNNLNKKNIEFLSGSGNISEIHRSSLHHEYLVNTSDNLNLLIEHTLFFPGWKLYVNNAPREIIRNDKGVITFKLNKGLNKVVIKFEATPIRLLSKYISISSILILSFIFIFREKLFFLTNYSHISSRNRNRNPN